MFYRGTQVTPFAIDKNSVAAHAAVVQLVPESRLPLELLQPVHSLFEPMQVWQEFAVWQFSHMRASFFLWPLGHYSTLNKSSSRPPLF